MLPPDPLAYIPRWISHWLGYRTMPPLKHPDYILWMWSWIGAFCGISVIQAVFGHAQYFIRQGVPSIIPSYGATAVLIYGAVEAPLAQPRALFAGHFLAALTGVIITKLFHLLPTEEHFQQLRWLAGSLSCATALVIMEASGTVHPPAGATALLPAVDDAILDIGWYYLPVVLLTSALALGVALLINNIQRRYPVFWVFPPVPARPTAQLVSAGVLETKRAPQSAQSTTTSTTATNVESDEHAGAGRPSGSTEGPILPV